MLARGWQLFIHSIVLLVEHHARDMRRQRVLEQ
jgi:hypothetical protein